MSAERPCSTCGASDHSRCWSSLGAMVGSPSPPAVWRLWLMDDGGEESVGLVEEYESGPAARLGMHLVGAANPGSVYMVETPGGERWSAS